MLNRYILLIFGNTPVQLSGNSLAIVRFVANKNDSYMIIDMKDGRIIEDRRKNVQADYDHPINKR